MRVWKNFMLIAGAVSMIYYLIMTVYAGSRTAFANFWLAVGVLGLAGSVILQMLLRRGAEAPVWLERIVWTLFAVCLLLFLLVEGLIVHASLQKPQPGADYVIVLGAQVRGTRVTRSLRYRLDAACSYLKENPQTRVIVSGGQGTGEDISEAAAMQQYLLEQGIEEGRILSEDRSSNTDENIRFSRQLMEADWAEKNGSGEPAVVIATSSFHVFRAKKIAEKQGFQSVSGLAAKNDKVLVYSYYVREALAVVKDFLAGNF